MESDSKDAVWNSFAEHYIMDLYYKVIPLNKILEAFYYYMLDDIEISDSIIKADTYKIKN